MTDQVKKKAARSSRTALFSSKPQASVLNARPDVPVGKIGQCRRHQQEDDDGQADLVPLLEIGLGGPDQEGSYVLRHLVHDVLLNGPFW